MQKSWYVLRLLRCPEPDWFSLISQLVTINLENLDFEDLLDLRLIGKALITKILMILFKTVSLQFKIFDSFENKISTVEKFLTVFKTKSWQMRNIWQFLKQSLDSLEILTVLKTISQQFRNIWQFQKQSLNSWEMFDSFKNNVLTVKKCLTVSKIISQQFRNIWQFQKQCLNIWEIFYSLKKMFQHLRKSLQFQKQGIDSWEIFYNFKNNVSTFLKKFTVSKTVEKFSILISIDCSWLLRPSSFKKSSLANKYFCELIFTSYFKHFV